MDDAAPTPRRLNFYENMLKTSTCNVGMTVDLPLQTDDAMKYTIREAWQRTVSEYKLLQVKLQGDDCLVEIDSHGDHESRLQFRRGPLFDLRKDLQRIGTTALNVTKSLYFVDVCVSDKGHLIVQVIVSLCHALSDGPGSLQVAKSFLSHLDAILKLGKQSLQTKETPHRDLIDIQALLLGKEYGAGQSREAVFAGEDEYKQALQGQGSEKPTTVLPPERLQNIPSEPKKQPRGLIQCVSFQLSQTETSKLREACRMHQATVQGALVAAGLYARVTLLELHLPVLAAIQIPVNTRRLANVDASECLCGSAGVWHTVTVEQNDWWNVATSSTMSTHDALTLQPKEWLRRLFQAPQTLPPYSLMVSSIGVAPIENASYDKLRVRELHFFGAALETSVDAQGTMVHALTFDGALTVMVNYTSPGISTRFAEETARLMKSALLNLMMEADIRSSK